MWRLLRLLICSPAAGLRRVALPLLALAVVLSAATSVLQAQTVCGVPGRQGAVTLAGTAVNSYFAGSGSPGAGSSSITLATGTNANRGATTTLLAGDLVLIIQMQDSSGTLEGNYEYGVVTVGGGVGATIQLGRPLLNSYAQSVAANTVRTFQVVRVPQYSAATLSGTVNVLPWFIEPTNGFGTGGVYAIDVAGSLTLNGVTIDANGKGFRGGRGVNSGQNRAGGSPYDANYACTTANLNGSFKGEGTKGTPRQVFGYNIGATAGAGDTYDAAGEVFNAGQGYPAGSCGQAAQGNAGGGGNDGVPPSETNGTNSGGGGGGNAAAGGIGGNSWNQNDYTAAHSLPTSVSGTGLGGFDAGGRGGNALGPGYASKIYLGGGGGAGSANNGSADSVTTFPPTNSATGNGAAGAITSSGAPGGGIVIMRAGTIAASAASTINAQGLRSYNKNPTGDTDSAGGGGGGGTIIIDAPGTAAIAGTLNLNAFGGIGGNSNYYNHGPGGGGGGGYIATSFTGAATSVIGGTAGTDGCCGGTNSNLSPKNYRAAPGSAGTVATGVGSLLPPGSPASARCLPDLTVTKTTSTPLITATTGATASYTINVSNAGGAATNVFIFDATLPPGWTYRTATPAPVYNYSPAPPLAGGGFAAGAETTAATGVAAPPVLPVNSATVVNSVTAVSLRAAATAPGVVPAAGAGTLTFGSFFIPQGGSISVTFGVSIPNTATVGTYHNPAGVVFLDPTRTAATGVRMVAPATGVNANRTGVAYSANTSFQSGGTTTIPGDHYSGLEAGPSGEDVQLLPDFSVTKTAPATGTPGRTITYTITARNNGRAIGSQTFAVSQATTVSTANVPSVLGSNPLTVTDTLPAGVTLSNVFTGAGWTCTGADTQVCTLANTSAYPIAASTNFAVITGTVTVTMPCSGATPLTNTATVSVPAGGTLTTNNLATATTSISCSTANLQVTKTNNVTSVVAGGTTSYTVTVSNLGPSAANSTSLTEVASAGLSCTTATCAGTGGAVCPAASMPFGSLTTGITIPTFPAASTATFVISCGVTATGF